MIDLTHPNLIVSFDDCRPTCKPWDDASHDIYMFIVWHNKAQVKGKWFITQILMKWCVNSMMYVNYITYVYYMTPMSDSSCCKYRLSIGRKKRLSLGMWPHWNITTNSDKQFCVDQKSFTHFKYFCNEQPIFSVTTLFYKKYTFI